MRPALAEAARTTAWTLALWAGVELAAGWLARSAIAAMAVQAAIAEWGAGRLAVTWSDPLAPPPSGRELRRRVGLGAGVGLAGAALVAALALVTRRASIAPSVPALGPLALGLLVAGLGAVRDELLLRGAVLGITRRLVGMPAAVLVCAAAAAAARCGALDPSALAIAVEALRGLALALLWVRDRGAWMPIAANTAWTWGLDSLTRGDLVDVRFGGEPAASGHALAVLAVLAGLAAWWVWSARRPG